MDRANSRRQFLLISVIAGSGLALTACGNKAAPDKTQQTKDKDVSSFVHRFSAGRRRQN